MDSDPFPIDLAKVEYRDFEGLYSLYHDGWYGSLELIHKEEGTFLGTYNSVRLNQIFKVTATTNKEAQHMIELVFHNFGENYPIPNQTFTGYLFTYGKNAIAGRTTWRGQPFGFFARKSGFLYLPDYGSGGESVQPQDFAGSYSLYYDGHPATLTLASHDSLLMNGVFSLAGSTSDLPVIAQINSEVPYEITISVAIAAGNFLQLNGHLFTRPKNGIAGYMDWGAVRSGFYMTKFR